MANGYNYFRCPECNTNNRVPDNFVRIEITCGKCGHKFVVKNPIKQVDNGKQSKGNGFRNFLFGLIAGVLVIFGVNYFTTGSLPVKNVSETTERVVSQAKDKLNLFKAKTVGIETDADLQTDEEENFSEGVQEAIQTEESTNNEYIPTIPDVEDERASEAFQEIEEEEVKNDFAAKGKELLDMYLDHTIHYEDAIRVMECNGTRSMDENGLMYYTWIEEEGSDSVITVIVNPAEEDNVVSVEVRE